MGTARGSGVLTHGGTWLALLLASDFYLTCSHPLPTARTQTNGLRASVWCRGCCRRSYPRATQVLPTLVYAFYIVSTPPPHVSSIMSTPSPSAAPRADTYVAAYFTGGNYDGTVAPRQPCEKGIFGVGGCCFIYELRRERPSRWSLRCLRHVLCEAVARMSSTRTDRCVFYPTQSVLTEYHRQLIVGYLS